MIKIYHIAGDFEWYAPPDADMEQLYNAGYILGGRDQFPTQDELRAEALEREAETRKYNQNTQGEMFR